MFKLIGRFMVFVGAIYCIATYIEGIHVDSTQTIFIVAVVWSIIIILVRPVLRLLTLPLRLLTLGLFSFVLNAALFGLMAYLVPGFTVDGFIPALIGSAILSFVTYVVDHVILA